MPNLTLQVTGALVGVVSREYKGFKDRSGGDVSGGITRTLYVSPSLDSEPIAVKFSDEQLGVVSGFARGAELVVECEVFARGNAVAYRAVDIAAKAKG